MTSFYHREILPLRVVRVPHALEFSRFGTCKLITCSIHLLALPNYAIMHLGLRTIQGGDEQSGFPGLSRPYWVDSNVFGGRDFFPRRRFGMREMPFGRI